MEAINAAKLLTGSVGFRNALRQLDAKNRPNVDRAALIVWALADRYRNGRGYVDETYDQLDAFVPFKLSRHMLGALDAIGVWIVSKPGGPGSPTRRVPGPLLMAHWETGEGLPAPVVAATREGTGSTREGETSTREGTGSTREGLPAHTPNNPHVTPSTTTTPTTALTNGGEPEGGGVEGVIDDQRKDRLIAQAAEKATRAATDVGNRGSYATGTRRKMTLLWSTWAGIDLDDYTDRELINSLVNTDPTPRRSPMRGFGAFTSRSVIDVEAADAAP